ncbi:stress-induced-phosphoprotein 1 [Pycnococcus provasolii]
MASADMSSRSVRWGAPSTSNSTSAHAHAASTTPHSSDGMGSDGFYIPSSDDDEDERPPQDPLVVPGTSSPSPRPQEALEEIGLGLPSPSPWRWDGMAGRFHFDGTQQELDTWRKASTEARQRGNEAFAASEYTRAYEAFTEAIRRDPTSASAWGNRSALYLESGDANAALVDARQMLNLCDEPDNARAKAYTRIASALFAIGKFREAYDAFGSALQIDPSNEVCLHGREECAARLPVPTSGDNLVVTASDRYAKDAPVTPARWEESGVAPRKPLTLKQVLELAAEAGFWMDASASDPSDTRPLRARVDLAKFFNFYGVTSLTTFNARYSAERLVDGGAPARWVDGRAVPGTGGTLEIVPSRSLASTVRRDDFL